MCYCLKLHFCIRFVDTAVRLYTAYLLFFSRLISYLFHAHKQKWIYENITFQDYNADFIHGLVVGLLRDVNKCLREYGELACVYMYSSVDGHLEVSCYS